MVRLNYRGESYQLYKGYYVAGNRICITAECPERNFRIYPLTLNYAAQSAPLTHNQAFINVPLFGYGIIGALLEAKAGRDTGYAIIDADGNEIPIFEFNDKFIEKLK